MQRRERKATGKSWQTKVSTEDYNRFQKYTNYAYQAGMIEEPNKSKYLRYIVTIPFKILKGESEKKGA